jgi:diguanylate cyclase (GGDEF)-like protein
MNEERDQITDFLSEIGNSLIEVERQFLNSMTQTEQVYNQNSTFDILLDSQMEDMKKSAQISSTFAEFKSLVMLRLASIRTALEEKRRAEALREETLNEEVEHLQQNLSRMKKEIDDVHEKRKALEKEILIDQLTGIANRRALKRRLKEELQRFQRYQQFFSILLFDIDHFKSINDQFGHWAGDKCLKEIIKRIKPILRETDFLARWGGEEFIILFPGTELESAFGVAERLRKTIEHTRFLYHKQEISLTVSIGVTGVQSADHGQETIFNRVDKAMYDAKRKGRNQVIVV